MKLRMAQRRSIFGWLFILPAACLIIVMNFFPMIDAFILSLRRGVGDAIQFAGIINYQRLLKDPLFLLTLKNTFLFLLIQVPIMLLLAIILAAVLNNKVLKARALFRSIIFIPCATALVSYAIVFRALFATEGFINILLVRIGLISENINWLGNTSAARFVIIIALLWRWTGYNMIFFLSGLQGIDDSIYESARIDGANTFQQFIRITIPLLAPMIVLTAIMSTNGTLQLFDESMNLTKGGPGNMTMSLSHYIYKVSFEGSPNFGYAAAISYVILFIVAILSFLQMKLGDKRD